MVGSGGSSRSSSLGLNSSAYCLHRRNQACAKQQESGRLRCDLASNLSTREVGVVNVGVCVSTIERGDKVSFRAGNGATLLGDKGRVVGSGKGQIDGSVEGSRSSIWERGERNRYYFVDSRRTAAMNVCCACGSGQSGEGFVNRQEIAVEGEEAGACSGTSSRRDFVGSQENSAVDDGVGVGGND